MAKPKRKEGIKGRDTKRESDRQRISQTEF